MISSFPLSRLMQSLSDERACTRHLPKPSSNRSSFINAHSTRLRTTRISASLQFMFQLQAFDSSRHGDWFLESIDHRCWSGKLNNLTGRIAWESVPAVLIRQSRLTTCRWRCWRCSLSLFIVLPSSLRNVHYQLIVSSQSLHEFRESWTQVFGWFELSCHGSRKFY